ncbi:MAG: hypothetical protein ACTSRG_22925 [Candidatus Helarchaeota archaeon]
MESFVKEEGLNVGASVLTYMGYNLIVKGPVVSLDMIMNLALNEVISRFLLKPLLSKVLNMIGIHIEKMEEVNFVLSHIGSYSLIYYFTNKRFPSIMEIGLYVGLTFIAEKFIAKMIKRWMLQNHFNFQNKLEKKIKNPRHRNRYDKHSRASRKHQLFRANEHKGLVMHKIL